MIRVIGYGNPGRGDDGLGPAFVEALEHAPRPGLEVLSAYQLSVEHALWISDAEHVVFVDALVGATEPVRFAPALPETGRALGSHALSPEAVLALSQTLFGQLPPAHVLGIAGASFGRVEEGLSAQARANLAVALRTFDHWLANCVPGAMVEA